ncbi:hypothetical protein [Providencia sp. wls1950]|uniref:hypothetical protein n=1 Tax=Providencia sp. wls1950 TaxID=2675147 RepID=UPI0012B67C72|nr:hypothetical protein [Providencia sp. wls1950]
MKNVIDVLSLISSIMTIMGITGVLSWGLSSKPEERSNIALYILALMFRVAVCIIVIAIFVWPFAMARSWFSFMLFDGPSEVISSLKNPSLWWRDDYSVSYILGYVVTIPITLVLIVPCVASIWSRSITPFKVMWNYVAGSEQEKKPTDNS